MHPDVVHVGMHGGRRAVSLRSAGAVVTFVHNWPEIHNVGDYLCSPRHYFDFTCHSPEDGGSETIAIVGGGAINDLGTRAAADSGGQRSIAWGIGRTIRAEDRSWVEIPSTDIFDAVGWRDRDLCRSGASLVPCPSVFNDITSIPPGPDTGVFLNANPIAGGAETSAPPGQGAVSVMGTNALGESELRARFARTGRIVTNSYHIAYWGLLSGRSVAVIGYSSKFQSLLDLLGLPSVVADYDRGDRVGLRQAVAAALQGRSYLRLESPECTKEEFREQNIAFAAKLVQQGLFASVRPSWDSPEAVRRREQEVWSSYRLSLVALP